MLIQNIQPKLDSVPTSNFNAELMKSAQSIEASFLSEMLKAAGVGKSRESFSGGIGENQFSTIIVNEYAAEIVNNGGIGLANSIYESLLKSE